jgi:purine-cytosine permease-like protein
MAKEIHPAGTVPGYRIALIILGIAMSPVLLSGSRIGSQLSLHDTIRAIVTGSLILAAIGCMTGAIGQRARMNTYQIVRYAFGTKGSLAINALLAISLFGWICVTANSFGMALQELLSMGGWHLPLFPLVAFGCILFVAATAFGFEVLGKVALYSIPVLLLILGYCLHRFFTLAPMHIGSHSGELSVGVATSSVVGTFMILATTMPDFGCMVHNRRHALQGAILALGIAYPLLYIAGALPTALSGQDSLVSAMALTASTLPALSLLLFSTITGNAGNLFQGTLVTSTLMPAVTRPRITMMLGALACLIGSQDLVNWFIPFLLFLGIAVPPIAGIYIADYLMNRREGYDEKELESLPAVPVAAFVVWGVATLVGFLTSRQALTLTGIPSLDALLVASVLFTLQSRTFGLPRTANQEV